MRISQRLSRLDLLVLFLSAGCGARSVHLDGSSTDGGASTNPNSSPDAIAPGVSIVVEDQETAIRIAVDDKRVYWFSDLPYGWSEGMPPRYARIRSCSKADCRATVVTYDQTTDDRSPTPVPPQRYTALAVGGDSVYWAQRQLSSQSTVFACPSTGCVGSPRIVVNNVAITSMATDESHLYWTSDRDTAIFRLALAGGIPEAIAVNEVKPDSLAVNATHVHWIAHAGEANAAIKRIPKAGGEPPVELATAQNQASFLAIDQEFVYWANSFLVGSIQRCPLSGCVAPFDVLVSHQNRPHALVADGTNVFWMTILDESNPLGPIAAVKRCPIASCNAAMTTLAVQSFSLEGMSMAADRSDVYWVAQGVADPLEQGFYPHATIYRQAK